MQESGAGSKMDAILPKKGLMIQCCARDAWVDLAQHRLYKGDPMPVRMTFAGLVAVGLSLAVVPLGCGAAAEDYVVVQSAAGESTTARV